MYAIIDYYLKRKISYYFVKRAFSSVKLIMREDNGVIQVTGINGTTDVLKDDFEYGYIVFDGSKKECSVKSIELEPYSRKVVLEFKKGCHDLAEGIYFARPITQKSILPTVLNQRRFRELKIPHAQLGITDFLRDRDDIKFTVSSDTYAHAVHFNLDDGINLSDEYFDLLPGESREITVYNAPGELVFTAITPKSISIASL